MLVGWINMKITEEDMLKQLENVFNLKYDVKKEGWEHIIENRNNDGEKEVDKDLIPMKEYKVKNLIRGLKKSEFKDVSFYQPTYFEKLVSVHSKELTYSDFLPSFDEGNDIIKKDMNTGLTFKISSPSLDFIMASYITFIKDKNSINSINDCPPLFMAQFSKSGLFKEILSFESFEKIVRSIKLLMFLNVGPLENKIERENKEKKGRKKKLDFENYMVNGVYANIKTIKILSSSDLKLETFEKLSDSFIFSLGYNVNMHILEFRPLNEDINYNPRLKLDEIEIPRRDYIKELIYYYQQALSADNPLLEYLSFYQILEYFYGIVVREDLMNDVKNKISHPKFSHRNNESILQLIDIVRKGKFEEQRALIHVLKRYLKLDELKNDLLNYCENENYYEYYINNKVNFANAGSIKGNKNEIMMDLLSNRIYDVRNALIHSKEGEKSKYTPFSENESELKKEIPLIRLVAEQIIINSSKDLELK